MEHPWSAELEGHRALLWGLCYRMTGSAQDADDLVQATFLRALERPPQDLARAWRPWLCAVAVNLCRDHLRRRRRAAYVGPWLPEPVEVLEEGSWALPGARYELAQSASFAFLVALERLAPTPRAVLLLRDVLGYTTQEAAQALGLSEPNVKTTLHRARRLLETTRDLRARASHDPDARARAMEALMEFSAKVMAQDWAGLEALLAHDVRASTDSAGVYLSARRVVEGPRKVAALFVGLGRRVPADELVAVPRLLHGGGWVECVWPSPSSPRLAPRWFLGLELDAAAKIAAVYVVSAPQKLTRL